MSGALFPAWMEDALCAQVDTEIFFPEKGGDPRPARKVCDACPVRAECLEYSLENHEQYGVWGGLGRHARAALLAKRRAA